MTVIWLSPRLPADRSTLAATLGSDVEISSAPLPPGGTSVAVATVFERSLLEQLAAVPGAGALLVLKPPGTATPSNLPSSGGPLSVVEAADVAEVASAVRGVLAEPHAPWPTPQPAAEPAAVAPSGWLLPPVDSPTGELPAAATAAVPAAAGRSRRRNWLASGGIIGIAAVAAVVVLATQGGASTSQTGFRGAGGSGGYGFGNGTVPGTGQAPGSGSSGSSGTSREAERQAFLDCLKKNGVDTSNVTQGQRPRLDPSDPTVATALQTCRSLLPQRGFGGDHDGDHDGTGTPPGGGSGGPGGGTGFPRGGTA